MSINESISESDVLSDSSNMTHDVDTPSSESPIESEKTLTSGEEESDSDRIEAIIDHRILGNRKQYLVKFSNFSDLDQWIDEKDLAKHSDLLADYIINGNSEKTDKDSKKDMAFTITDAYRTQEGIYYKLLYQNGTQTSISSKEMYQLDSFKLIDFLEKYCIQHKKVQKD